VSKPRTPRCRYCGQYVAYAQLAAGIAVRDTFPAVVATDAGPDVRDVAEVFHPECKPSDPWAAAKGGGRAE